MSMEERTEKATRAFQSNFAQFGRGVAILGAGLATLGGVFALSETAGKFEAAIAGVAAVSGASAGELKQLRDAAIAAGIATQYSPIQATVGLRELAQAGYTAKESITLLTPVLDLAAGSLGELTPQSAAGLAAQTLKAFGLEMSQASVAVDQMLQAVNVFALGAGELPLALGIASRGAQTLKQSLTETLVALGLVKNIIPTVERASTATAVAMERLANPKVRQQLAGIGVAVTDAHGHFRPFLDIIGRMAPALDRMSEARRATFLLKTFGAEGLAGVNAILTQITHGVRTSTGEMLRGGDAVAYLRKQFAEANGTAAQFRDKLLDTFEGQKQLLHGSLETLAIVVGEPFAKALKPIVGAIISVVNAVLGVVQSMPEPIKRAFAKAVLAIGTLLTVFGAFVAVKAAIALIGSALAALGITLGGLLSVMLPVIALFGVFAATVAGFSVAFQRDVGGLASFVTRTWEEIKLLFRGLAQLFDEGGFSGAVMAELNRAENAGVKQFAIRVYQIVFRIQRFFEGLADGFAIAIERARPVFAAFVGSLREVGAAFGVAGSASADALAAMHSNRYAQAGASVGSALASIATTVVRIWTAVNQVFLGIVAGFQSAYNALKPVLEFAGEALGFLGEEIRAIVEDLTGARTSGQEQVPTWKAVGQVIGWLAGIFVSVLAGAVGVVALALHTVLQIVHSVIDGFISLGGWIGETASGLSDFFSERLPKALASAWSALKRFFAPVTELVEGVVETMKTAIDKWLGFLGRLAVKIPARFRSDFLDEVISAGQAADHRLVQRAAQTSQLDPFGSSAAPSTTPAAVLAGSSGLFSEPALPAVAAVETQSRMRDADIDALISRGLGRTDDRPLQAHVSLVVDGETLARASATATRNARARSFLPVSEAE